MTWFLDGPSQVQPVLKLHISRYFYTHCEVIFYSGSSVCNPHPIPNSKCFRDVKQFQKITWHLSGPPEDVKWRRRKKTNLEKQIKRDHKNLLSKYNTAQSTFVVHMYMIWKAKICWTYVCQFLCLHLGLASGLASRARRDLKLVSQSRETWSARLARLKNWQKSCILEAFEKEI